MKDNAYDIIGFPKNNFFIFVKLIEILLNPLIFINRNNLFIN